MGKFTGELLRWTSPSDSCAAPPGWSFTPACLRLQICGSIGYRVGSWQIKSLLLAGMNTGIGW